MKFLLIRFEEIILIFHCFILITLFQGHCAANNGYGGAAYFDYNNQANWKNVNGNTNDKVRWSKFPSIFNFKMQNQCGFGNQSPINVCDGSSGPKNENAECFESHRIFQHVSTFHFQLLWFSPLKKTIIENPIFAFLRKK